MPGQTDSTNGHDHDSAQSPGKAAGGGQPWASLVEWVVVTLILITATCAFAQAVGLEIGTLGSNALERLGNILGGW